MGLSRATKKQSRRGSATVAGVKKEVNDLQVQSK
jgi:hypothetical protein